MVVKNLTLLGVMAVWYAAAAFADDGDTQAEKDRSESREHKVASVGSDLGASILLDALISGGIHTLKSGGNGQSKASSVNRADKHVELLIGADTLGTKGFFEANFFISNDNLLGLGSGAKDGTDETWLRHKFFWGNSFYSKIGLMNRTKTWSQDVWGLDNNSEHMPTSRKVGEFEATSQFAEILIGNQWLYNAFTIGCDWIGYGAPISPTRVTYRAIDPSVPRNESDYKDAKLSSNTYYLLNLYLGFAI